MQCLCACLFIVALQDWSPESAFSHQRRTVQSMPCPNQPTPVLSGHRRPHQDSTEGQRTGKCNNKYYIVGSRSIVL